MISKERLEELIKQGATIYFVFNDIVDEKEGIYNDDFILNETYVSIFWNTRSHQVRYEHLFETRKDAEWHRDFGCIERTERLEFPTWQQIENIIEQKKKFGLNHSDRILARIITNDSIYYFKLCKDLDLFTFELKQTYIGEDLCEQLTSRFPVSLGKTTKENYTIACKKCKELFLGENNNDK